MINLAIAEKVLLAPQPHARPGHDQRHGVDVEVAQPSPRAGPVLEDPSGFGTYLQANAGRILNYGERNRAGEVISSSLAESAVNQMISMVKKQQMRWSPRGAHLLLQVRTRTLNDDLAADFRRWYPGLTTHLGSNDRRSAGRRVAPTVCPTFLLNLT